MIKNNHKKQMLSIETLLLKKKKKPILLLPFNPSSPNHLITCFVGLNGWLY